MVRFGTGDVLTMELNLDIKELTFWLKGHDEAIRCFNNITTAEYVYYSIILCINVRNDRVTLLKYEESS